MTATIAVPTQQTFTISPQGAFSLTESALFGFGQRTDASFDGVMRMAFCLDGYRQQVGVELRQSAAGTVDGLVQVADAEQVDLTAVRAQVARVLSLDHDGAGFAEVGRRDPVIGALQAVAPGLRPPLFYSPYEAAAWSVLSARRPGKQMAAIRARLSETHGTTFTLAGRRLAAFPTPRQLLRVSEFAGLEPARIQRLHAVAHAAIDGRLHPADLLAMGPESAMVHLQQFPGIGPFYSSLIVIRATGFADVMPYEPRVLERIRTLYHLPAIPNEDEVKRISQAWSPFRTWVAVLIRAASARLSAAA